VCNLPFVKTLPRLELMAALVATHLTRVVMDSISLQNIPIVIWSDSQIVLHWIKSQKQLPAFVRNRIAEMKSQSPNVEWTYCPTLENPADLLTRVITTNALISSSLWKNGRLGSPHLTDGLPLTSHLYHRS